MIILQPVLIVLAVVGLCAWMVANFMSNRAYNSIPDPLTTAGLTRCKRSDYRKDSSVPAATSGRFGVCAGWFAVGAKAGGDGRKSLRWHPLHVAGPILSLCSLYLIPAMWLGRARVTVLSCYFWDFKYSNGSSRSAKLQVNCRRRSGLSKLTAGGVLDSRQGKTHERLWPMVSQPVRRSRRVRLVPSPRPRAIDGLFRGFRPLAFSELGGSYVVGGHRMRACRCWRPNFGRG